MQWPIFRTSDHVGINVQNSRNFPTLEKSPWCLQHWIAGKGLENKRSFRENTHFFLLHWKIKRQSRSCETAARHVGRASLNGATSKGQLLVVSINHFHPFSYQFIISIQFSCSMHTQIGQQSMIQINDSSIHLIAGKAGFPNLASLINELTYTDTASGEERGMIVFKVFGGRGTVGVRGMIVFIPLSVATPSFSRSSFVNTCWKLEWSSLPWPCTSSELTGSVIPSELVPGSATWAGALGEN